MIFDIYDVDNDNQAAKSKGDEVPLDDLLIVLDVFDDKRADLPLGAFRGESAPEKLNFPISCSSIIFIVFLRPCKQNTVKTNLRIIEIGKMVKLKAHMEIKATSRL